MAVSVFEAAGGRDVFLALAEAWHLRCLADPVVSHAFAHGFHPQHTQRLAAYWAEALGGPADYTGLGGLESDVVRLHSGNGVHAEMDERAQACFAGALDDVGVPGDLRATLMEYFRWSTGVLATYPDSADDVPAGLPMRHWSWDGPVAERPAG